MNYKIAWDNGHDCGEFPQTFTSKRAAEQFAREWKRDMIAAEPPETRAEARAAYSWEIVEAKPEESPEVPPGECPHGKPTHECDACMEASDHAFDCDRESRFFGSH